MLPRSIVLAAVLPIASAATVGIASQHSAIPRARDGRPDLQGTWDYATMTPLQRTKDFENRAFFTQAEAAEFERGAAERRLRRLSASEQKVNADIVGDFSTFEQGHLDPSLRTSIIVDPPDGKLPPRTADAKARDEAREKLHDDPDGPEALTLAERCLPDVAGPPLLSEAYNNHLQIGQTRTYLLMATEMNEARIVPLDGRPHLPPGIRLWNGDSRGRWEGDTVVIDTTNFADKSAFEGASAALHVVERLTPVDAVSMRYEFRVEDPAEFTAPWAGSYTIRRTRSRVFEYACHEGNYSLVGMLRGARARERELKK